MKKYLNYIITIMVIAVFVMTGCDNSISDDYTNASLVFNEIINEKTVPVESDGSLNMAISGVSIKAEKDTFDPDVSVKFTESKVSEGMGSNFSSASNLYTLSAEKIQESPLGETKIPVTSVDNLITITVPNNLMKKGVYYIGTRANSSQSWKYTVVNENNSPDNPLVLSSRYATGYDMQEFYVRTYNTGFQFAVFVEEKETPVTDRTVITGFIAEADPYEYELEKNYYKDDINVKVAIAGDNLSNLSFNDFSVEIGFLNEDGNQYNQNSFPINGAVPVYIVSGADAGAGNKYKHTITLKSIQNYHNNTLSFTIGASKLTQQILPNKFTITVNVDEKQNTLAFADTKGITLINKSKDEPREPEHEITFINVVTTSPANGATNIATDSESIITVKFDKELKQDTHWEEYVTMTNDSGAIPLSFQYSDKVLTIKHDTIEADKLYTVKIKEGIDGVEAYTRTSSYAFAFTTGKISSKDEPVPPAEITYINIVSTSVKNGATNVATASGNITVTFEKELAANNDWNSFVTLANSENNIKVDVAYSDKTLTISHKGLTENTLYTLLVKSGLKGVEDNTETVPAAIAFSTAKPGKTKVTAEMKTPSVTSGTSVSTNVVIAFSDDIKWEDESKNMVTLHQGTTQIECGYSYSDKVLTLTPAAKLSFNKTYTVKISRFLTPQNENAEMQDNQQFEFTTVASEGTPSITADTSKSADGKYYLTADHKFSIDFNKLIINEETAKQNIFMQKNGMSFHDYSLEFDATMHIANLNVNVPFEADATYKIGVSAFTDSDGSVVKDAESSFTAMPAIELESIELDCGSGWQPLSNNNVASITGKIRAILTQPIEPAAVKLVDKSGTEITAPVISNKTTEKNNTIEFDYNGLEYQTTYGITISYADSTTGQSIECGTITFETTVPDCLVLADKSQPNSETNPYLVYTAKALDQIRETDYCMQNYYYKQMADIDLAPSAYTSPNNTPETGWTPIGIYDEENDVELFFIGHYDGNNKVIKNMFCNFPDNWELAASLFGLFADGSVKNLGVVDVNINGPIFVGAIAGYVENATIDGCYSSGEIICNQNIVGGLIGNADNIVISNSYSTANITNNIPLEEDTPCSEAGGLIGNVDSGTFINCQASGEIKGEKNIGGLIGSIGYHGIVAECTAKNKITGVSTIGGIIGNSANNVVIDNCKAVDISIIATGDDIGGITGFNNGTIERCVSSGHIEGNDNVGGITGSNAEGDTTYSPKVLYSDSECSVKGNDNIGGIAGYNQGEVYFGTSAGSIEGNNNVGGIAGSNHSSTNIRENIASVRVTDSYSNVSGVDNVGGVVGYNDGNIDDSRSYEAISGNDYVGGVVGYTSKCSMWDKGGNVTKSESSSDISGQNYVGGIIGCIDSGEVTPYNYTSSEDNLKIKFSGTIDAPGVSNEYIALDNR